MLVIFNVIWIMFNNFADISAKWPFSTEMIKTVRKCTFISKMIYPSTHRTHFPSTEKLVWRPQPLSLQFHTACCSLGTCIIDFQFLVQLNIIRISSMWCCQGCWFCRYNFDIFVRCWLLFLQISYLVQSLFNKQ